MSVLDLTAVELGKKIKAKEITVVDAVKAVSGADKKTGACSSRLCDCG